MKIKLLSYLLILSFVFISCDDDSDAETKEPLLGIYTISKSILTADATSANGLATIGAGTLVGIEILDAVILAGTLGCVKVAEDLSRAYLDDGKLTLDEINEAFSKLDRSKK